MDALSVWDRVTSGAALALTLPFMPTPATAFAAPVADLGDVVRDVASRIRRDREAAAVKRVNRWVTHKLYPALVEVVPVVGRAVPEEVTEAFGTIIVWGVGLAVDGVPKDSAEVVESPGTALWTDTNGTTVALLADRVEPGMLSALNPAGDAP